ncbi:MAG: PAS domain S-box protein, partial [Bacteroidales bacterium]|nr:PAS domain S-box protein [Bacteroidales bacterium]
QMNLETQNQETEIEVLKMISEKEKLQLANKQYKRTKIFVVVIFLLFLLYLLFIYYRSRERKKAADVLKHANERLKLEVEERKKAEFISKSNEKQYELVFNQTPVGILQFDENLIISNVNERFAEIFYKTSVEINNKHLNSIFDRNTVQKIIYLFESKEEIIKLRNEIPTKKEVVFVSVTVKKYRLWIKNNEVIGGIIIVQDFTEQKKAERYYKANIKLKQMLVKQIPDDIILLDDDENILEIHFPDAPEREVGVSKLEDIFKDSTLSVFRTHLLNSKYNKKTSQFFFSDNYDNFLVRVFPANENVMIIISRFEGEAQDAGIIIKEQSNKKETSVDNYIIKIQEGIEQELLPIYQNIQRGLSFIMIKNFAEKIVELGKTYNNKKIKDFGEKLLDHVTSFNVFKVNQLLDDFPSFISQFMGISSKF